GGVIACFFFSSRRRHTRFSRDWSSDVCSSDLVYIIAWYWHTVNMFFAIRSFFASGGAAAHVLAWCWHGMGGRTHPGPAAGPPPGHGTLLGASKFCQKKHGLNFLLTPKPLMR